MEHENVVPIGGGREPQNPNELAAATQVWEARKTFDHGRGDVEESLSLLCESFHVLDGCPGTRPFGHDTLAKQSRLSGHGKRCAIAFVLSVWNYSEEAHKIRKKRFHIVRFDIHEALGCWDAANRAAFAAWCAEPWWY